MYADIKPTHFPSPILLVFSCSNFLFLLVSISVLWVAIREDSNLRIDLNVECLNKILCTKY